MIEAPILHVNGDDPEACVTAAKLAVEFRDTFKRDIIIDFVCYRRRGHNESDEPFATQPLMYSKIKSKKTVTELYSEKLIANNTIDLNNLKTSNQTTEQIWKKRTGGIIDGLIQTDQYILIGLISET